MVIYLCPGYLCDFLNQSISKPFKLLFNFMKKQFTLMRLCLLGLMSFALSFTALAQDLLISGVIDGPLSGGVPKAVELFVINDIADLSTYSVSNFNNGNTSATGSITLSGSASAGEYIYLVSSSTDDAELISFFGSLPSNVFRGSGSAIAINGDDAIVLANNGNTIDAFGDVGVDGSNQPWEYLDGWAYRTDETGPDGTTFVISNWTFSGRNALDGETTNAGATTPFPIGTYQMTPPVPLLISGVMDGTSFRRCA